MYNLCLTPLFGDLRGFMPAQLKTKMYNQKLHTIGSQIPGLSITTSALGSRNSRFTYTGTCVLVALRVNRSFTTITKGASLKNEKNFRHGKTIVLSKQGSRLVQGGLDQVELKVNGKFVTSLKRFSKSFLLITYWK